MIGPGTRPGVLSPSVLEFVKKQAAKATYILSVCTGSWVLADAGVLDGKRATTNKASFKACMVSIPSHLMGKYLIHKTLIGEY